MERYSTRGQRVWEERRRLDEGTSDEENIGKLISCLDTVTVIIITEWLYGIIQMKRERDKTLCLVLYGNINDILGWNIPLKWKWPSTMCHLKSHLVLVGMLPFGLQHSLGHI